MLEVARRLGVELMPWQQHVADVSLELDDDGQFVYSESDVAVPRQSGKTLLTMARMVWRATVAAHLWGPQRVTYTAQTRLMARRKLERDFVDLLRSTKNFREVLNQRQLPTRPNEFRLSLNNGSEHLRFGTNSYLGIDAPSRTAGHGDSLDEGTIDEAFSHQDDDVEQAMLPAQATRTNPQIWVQSTAGDEKSFYWYRKILAGRVQEEGGSVAFFEWSIPDDADIDDPAVWWEFHPALGYTITENFLASGLAKARRTAGGEALWRRAYGNQWVKVPVLEEDDDRPIPAEAWAARLFEGSTIVGPLALAIDVSPNPNSFASIAVSGFNERRERHVEVIDHRPGTSWVLSRVLDLQRMYAPVAIALDPAGPAGSLVADLEASGVDLHKIGAREHGQACGALYEDVCGDAPNLAHIGQPSLDAALAGANKRPLGDAWAWDRKKSVDICPLVAVTLARWAHAATVPDDPPLTFAY